MAIFLYRLYVLNLFTTIDRNKVRYTKVWNPVGEDTCLLHHGNKVFHDIFGMTIFG